MKPAHAALAAFATAVSVACGPAGLPGSSDGPPSTPRWAPAARIDDAAREDVGTLLAVSAQGRVIAVLTGSKKGRGFVSRYGQRSSRYSNATGWSAAEDLPFVFDSDLASAVDVDDEGTARAWGVVGVGFGRRVWWSRSRDGAPWSAPEILPPSALDAYRPTIVGVDREVDLAAWLDLERGASTSLWASVRHEGMGWTPAQRLSGEGEEVGESSAAADGRGRALVVWNVIGRGDAPLFARAFDRASGWTEAERIGASGTGLAIAFVNGRALALWNSARGLFMSVRGEEGDWAPESRGPGDGQPVVDVQLAMSESGGAIAIWRQSAPEGYALYGATYDPHGGWTSSRFIAALVDPERTYHVVLDRAGRGVAAWSMKGQLCGLISDPHAGWAPTAECFGTGDDSALATDGAGHVLAAWPNAGAIWYSTLELGGR